MTQPFDFTNKQAPVDADRVPFVQSPGGSGDERHSTWAQLKTALNAALAFVAPARLVTTGTGLTGGGDLSADRTLALTGQALALHNLSSNGVIARTASGTVAGRTITAGAGIAVTNGDGVSGNPTIATTGAVTASGLTMATGRLLGRTTASTGAIEEITVGSGLSLTGGALTATGGGSGGDPWNVGTASNPASPYTLPTLDGNAVSKITALAGNLTINKPAGTATSGERAFRVIEIAATGADRTITWGTGISLGLGVAPSLVVPSGSTVRFVLYTDDAWATALYDGDFATATETSRGLVELATSAEINTGTDASRAISPDQLAASYAGTKAVSLPLTALQTDDLAIGDGQAVLVIPASAHGMNLVGQVVTVATAGTTGTTDIQLRRVRAGSAVDMLSTKLTIDSAETSSITAATPAVIDASNDDVQTGDLIFVDIDATATTKPKGGAVALEFRLP